jgi:hypothetical protein
MAERERPQPDTYECQMEFGSFKLGRYPGRENVITGLPDYMEERGMATAQRMEAGNDVVLELRLPLVADTKTAILAALQKDYADWLQEQADDAYEAVRLIWEMVLDEISGRTENVGSDKRHGKPGRATESQRLRRSGRGSFLVPSTAVALARHSGKVEGTKGGNRSSWG